MADFKDPTSCLEKALENPRLNDVLLGLDRKDVDFAINPKFFPCCNGRAEIWAKNSVHRCGIMRRQVVLQRLAAIYRKLYAKELKDLPALADAKSNDAAIRELAAMIRGESPQALRLDAPAQVASALWLRAAAGVWRFGLHPVVSTFDLMCDVRIRAELKALPQNEIPIIMLERVHKLWDAKFAFSFEAIISLAYMTNSILLFSMEEDQAPSGANVPQNFAKKLGQLRARTYDSWLEPESRARLKHLMTEPRLEPVEPIEQSSLDW